MLSSGNNSFHHNWVYSLFFILRIWSAVLKNWLALLWFVYFHAWWWWQSSCFMRDKSFITKWFYKIDLFKVILQWSDTNFFQNKTFLLYKYLFIKHKVIYHKTTTEVEHDFWLNIKLHSLVLMRYIKLIVRPEKILAEIDSLKMPKCLFIYGN